MPRLLRRTPVVLAEGADAHGAGRVLILVTTSPAIRAMSGLSRTRAKVGFHGKVLTVVLVMVNQ